jgi:DNA processing protein
MGITTLKAERTRRPKGEFARDTAQLLALLELPRVGSKTALRAALSGVEFEALLERHAARWPAALARAHELLEDCERLDICVLSLFDEGYPQRLLAIHDPPPLLFVRGAIDALRNERMVAVVGTREPTSFGREATVQLTSVLACDGWGVVSGLARGVDTLAHAVALDHQVSTVAVMAGGLDSVYPRENTELAAAIVDSGGALIAEVPPGVQPQRSHFVARDRLQAALAVAVVVAQTGIKGGTMHTVRYAAAQGRPVFCARPPSKNEQSAGLSVLLESPAQELCHQLPAWADARRLCKRLGSRPLARGVSTQEELDDMLDGLEFALKAQQAPSEPPPLAAGEGESFIDDYAATGYDKWSPVFALVD